jgi:single-strand DNA-binding protein
MYNLITLIGHLGQAPETKNLSMGSSVTRLSLATSISWKNTEGVKSEKTEWHSIVLWNKLGQVAQDYLEKGSKVLIVGRVEYRKVEKNGETRYYTDVIASEMRLLSTKSTPTNSSPENNLPKGQPKSLTALRPDDKEDLPF